MNLGDQLRETLGEEADMQYATPPDVDRLIIGGRQRRRHRNLVRAGGTALALVLIGGGAYAVLQTDPAAEIPIVDTPKAPPELPEDAGASTLEPGTYRVLVGAGADGAAIEADLTFALSKRRKAEGGFPGWPRIAKELEDGALRKRVGLKVEGRQPVREGGVPAQAAYIYPRMAELARLRRHQ